MAKLTVTQGALGTQAQLLGFAQYFPCHFGGTVCPASILEAGCRSSSLALASTSWCESMGHTKWDSVEVLTDPLMALIEAPRT